MNHASDSPRPDRREPQAAAEQDGARRRLAHARALRSEVAADVEQDVGVARFQQFMRDQAFLRHMRGQGPGGEGLSFRD